MGVPKIRWGDLGRYEGTRGFVRGPVASRRYSGLCGGTHSFVGGSGASLRYPGLCRKTRGFVEVLGVLWGARGFVEVLGNL